MRVIARVEGGASRREAAEQLDISPSAPVKWVKCLSGLTPDMKRVKNGPELWAIVDPCPEEFF
jgi:hypothetical protein